MNRRLIALLAMAALTVGAQAKVRLPHLIGDNMIVQQNTQARLWGWDQPGKKVVVSTSWTDTKYTAKTDKSGRWEVKVDTPEGSMTTLSITFDDGEPVTISGVLSGEVWVCAGQSNMEMPLRGFGQCPVEDYNNVVLDASGSAGVHFAKIPSVMSMTPQEDANCEWKVCSPSTVSNASATGYFFARLVNRTLGIPVGIIEANKGGTRVEAWLNEQNLKTYTDEPLDSVSIYSRGEMERQLVWGNATFNPVLKYTVKGIVYYQGCSNVGNHTSEYAERLALLVKQWREGFGLGEIPFYFVEIAPYFYDNSDGTAAALLREQQYKASTMIPHSGLVGTNDAAYKWEYRNIHPSQKRKVGERLALWALADTYGQTGLIHKSPSYESMTVVGNEVHVKLKDTFDGVQPIDFIEGFEVAGADRVFHKATAYADWWKGIVVSSPEVSEPVAVRYCFHNFALGNLKNQGGLPLIPFRSDNWDE